MELPWSLDEVARASDEQVVRRRFGQRNVVWLFVLLLFYGAVAVMEMVASTRTPFDLVIASANFTLVAIALLFLRDAHRLEKGGAGVWGPGRWIRNHVSAAVITYVTLQFVLSLAFTRHSNDYTGWIVTVPLMMMGFRMIVAEIVLLHAILAATSVITLFLLPMEKHEGVGFYIAIASINVIAMAIELFTSYRLRRQVLAEFTERRSQAREQIRMRDELRYARELQLSMLPEHAPRLDWVDLSSMSVPATEVGGDYYDYFIDGDRIALVCGDVAGHGMAAGLVLSAVRSGFTLLREALTDPALVLQRLHDLVAQTSRRRMLVTVAVVLLDRATRTATVASAGHPPIVLRRVDGSVETIDLYAPPLGVKLPVAIPQRQLTFASGDVFVLHSDGIYETTNARGDTYGFERLERVVAEHGAARAEELRDAILRDVAAFRGERELHDDITIVVARIA
ncbi:MAG: PP2C family protein-serine/threonine phosphatase [Acidobacteria bacterium]|nr:PP2C family protein-serine/threonine phosphatase [Acidobacteriota bacterium]MBV9478914.1 PP2C family protein-serine/threonine phosphatase [Acidobacteriota bacterium]